jgi:hypothetical protein
MRALIARDLADESLAGLSADRRFATAYNAALQAANMAIACAGYRIVSKVGHHRVSLESTKLVLAKAAHKYADSFAEYKAEIEGLGPRPSRQHTVNRIDNDGHYEKGNLNWSTPSEQRRNQRPQSEWLQNLPLDPRSIKGTTARE